MIPANFLRYFMTIRGAEPTWEGAEGEDTGVYGEKLTANPRPHIELGSVEADVDLLFHPSTYFHGNIQRALWQLGDYGVPADAWCLYNQAQEYKAIDERELWVLRVEAMAQLERQNLDAA
jgi:hypothetical protein